MEFIRGLHNLRDRHRGCVLCIGNFDGFHLGHQALIARLREHSERLGLPATVQIFEPTPREVFRPEQAPGRVTMLGDKLEQLQQAGVSRVLCVRFSRRFAAMPAGQYVADVLVGKLGVGAVVVGDDFRFGAGRGGDFGMLERLGKHHGFAAEAVETVTVGEVRASSTAVREALAVPDLECARRLLGRPYSMSGRVRPGLRLGRTLGMPTANIVLKRRPALRYGVYAVGAQAGSRSWDGVANVGVRPTLGLTRCLLEAHLFGDAGDLYGQRLKVTFRRFLRPEQRFASVEDLAAQMKKDAERAAAILSEAKDLRKEDSSRSLPPSASVGGSE